MASGRDHMSGLPFEIKQTICAHLVDILADEHQAKRQALGALRLTARSWSEAPCALLFHSLRVDLCGSRGLDDVFRLSTISDVFRHVRSLTVHVNVYVDSDSHFAAKSILVDKESAALPGHYHPLVPASRAKLQRRLRELFQDFLAALTKLESLGIENACPLALSNGPEIFANQVQLLSSYGDWSFYSDALNKELITGFLDSSSNATELSITGHPIVFEGLAGVFSQRVPDAFNGRVNHPILLSVATSKLTKLQLHYFDNPPFYMADPYLGLPVVTTDGSFRRMFKPITNLEQLLVLDIGKSSLDSLGRMPYHRILPALDHMTFPRLKSLTLRSYSISSADYLTTFINKRMPVLDELRLNDALSDGSQCWWDIFAHVRENCTLKRFRLMGSMLGASRPNLPWHIGIGQDPRPEDMGDSIEHGELEAWVTGADVPNPRERLNQRIHRVMVWNCGKQARGR